MQRLAATHDPVHGGDRIDRLWDPLQDLLRPWAALVGREHIGDSGATDLVDAYLSELPNDFAAGLRQVELALCITYDGGHSVFDFDIFCDRLAQAGIAILDA